MKAGQNRQEESFDPLRPPLFELHGKTAHGAAIPLALLSWSFWYPFFTTSTELKPLLLMNCLLSAFSSHYFSSL